MIIKWKNCSKFNLEIRINKWGGKADHVIMPTYDFDRYPRHGSNL